MSKLVLSLKQHKIGYGILVLSLSFIIIIITVFVQRESKPIVHASTNYTYEKIDSLNWVTLHVLRTEPQYIQLLTINNNVLAAGIYGINGGFFWDKSLLSIAVTNDQPVNGQPKQYGSGWYNAKYPRGTLVFDQQANKLSIQVVSSADEIQVTNRSQYWAQGGISMNLQDDAIWKLAVLREVMPFPDDYRLRSGMVYDQENNVYLIVSSVKCTAEFFRDAIKEQFANQDYIDGIFLDGDGSSQMLVDEVSLQGDGRMVVQMLMLK
jgi:hypothetical protein